MSSFSRQQSVLKRLRGQNVLRRTRRFWVRPGRTSAWWDNLTAGIAIEEEWKENFRMSRSSPYSLAEELRPYIKGRAFIMRSPVDVVRQVAITSVMKADFEKQLMLLEFQDKLFQKLFVKSAEP